jgi:hypothetical protein
MVSFAQGCDELRVIVKICALEVVVNLIPKESECPNDILRLTRWLKKKKYLVEEIGNHLGDPAIRPSSMNQNQSA